MNVFALRSELVQELGARSGERALEHEHSGGRRLSAEHSGAAGGGRRSLQLCGDQRARHRALRLFDARSARARALCRGSAACRCCTRYYRYLLPLLPGWRTRCCLLLSIFTSLQMLASSGIWSFLHSFIPSFLHSFIPSFLHHSHTHTQRISSSFHTLLVGISFFFFLFQSVFTTIIYFYSNFLTLFMFCILFWVDS